MKHVKKLENQTVKQNDLENWLIRYSQILKDMNLEQEESRFIRLGHFS